MFINSIIDTRTNDALNYMCQITPEFFPYKFSHNSNIILILSLSINNNTPTLQELLKWNKIRLKIYFKNNILNVEWAFP